MKLRTKYILFVIILHLAALALSLLIFEKNLPLFFVAEIVILISAWLAWQLYLALIRPLRMIMQAVESMRDRDFNTKFLLTGTFEMDQLIQAYNRMIDHLRRERTRLEEQHFFLEKLIFTSPIGIIIYGIDENIFNINPKAADVLGVDAGGLPGSYSDLLSHPLVQEAGSLHSGENKTISINGFHTYKVQKSHFMDRGAVRYFITIEEMTAEILAAEKTGYGKVIRMMAHEVNNTVGPVNSILRSTLQFPQHSDAIGNALQVAIQRNDNLNHFMRNFADLVRIPLPDKRPVDMLQLTRNVTDLMRMQAGEKKVDFRIEHSLSALTVNADAQQMEHVLINIFKNSLEAFDAEGSISVLFQTEPSGMIIRDTGRGIPSESQALLFTPFFSTKRDGQGVGLTLIREILVNHGFRFSLKTLAPGLTEFVIQF